MLTEAVVPVRCVECGETRSEIQAYGLYCAGFDSKTGALVWRRPRHRYDAMQVEVAASPKPA